MYNKMMLLKDLLKNVEVKEIVGRADIEIVSISQDSRDSSFENGLYFAVKGTQVDGHGFIVEVIQKKAIAIVCENIQEATLENVTYVVVENSRQIVGEVASNFYGNPSQELKIIAVTGTNGKTSIASYAAEALGKLREKVLLLSTAGDYFNGKSITLDRKAPSSLESIELQRVLREYVDMDASYVCLEATSQGLDQDRLSGVDIDVAIFANLGQDHLDYHKTLDHYGSSKKLLFDNLKPTALAISNYDDEFGQKILKDTQGRIVSYGSQTNYDFSFTIEKRELGSIAVNFNQTELILPVIGEFNIYNILAVYGALVELGYDAEKTISILQELNGVPGRMQQIPNSKGILALVDYAHSPGALENVLRSLKSLPHGNITTIIGCGGDRDRTKRAPMASVVQKLSNNAIYTADNPRTEELNQIFEDMREGVDSKKENYKFIENREEAIKYAVENSMAGDVIVVAGKGHEDYQIIGVEKNHFDDSEVLEKYLNIIN
ncbi:MAG: UDP-N-acetylmuramoyl-L-alanyl-D-glutamate--2,6-diaminopimelate ligase [Candidatus Paceibacteria bacterium]|jgi:UDP-N-acetylmuramoyl-L-alanyl-D-glutamate--2,6-diaminopimelate ligase